MRGVEPGIRRATWIPGLRFTRPGMTAVEAVNSREKPDYLRISRRPPYIHGRLADLLECAERLKAQFTDALYAPIPR
jgi:hypothetical protein